MSTLTTTGLGVLDRLPGELDERTAAKPAKPKPAPADAGAGQLLTVAEVCAEIGIGRTAFFRWRGEGTAPECHRLPGGDLRISRADLDAWKAKSKQADKETRRA